MNIDDFEQMKNQDFAFACLQLLFSSNNEKRYISDLQNGEWCKDMGFMQRAKPILKAIPDGLSDEDLKSAILDGTSQSRYYSSVFVFDNKQYLVTNQKGQILVTKEIADAFKKGNGDFNIFINDLGLSQNDVDFAAIQADEYQTKAEKQYSQIEYIIGEKNTKIIDNEDRLVVL